MSIFVYTEAPLHVDGPLPRTWTPSFLRFEQFRDGDHGDQTGKGELVFVALWILPPTSVSYLKFLCPSNAVEYVAAQRDVIFKGIDEKYPDYDDYNRARIRAHCAAWSDLFLASPDKHSLSSAITHEHLYGDYGDGHIDAVCYGSIVDPRFANYALHTHLADSLQLYRVYACHTTDQPNYFLFSKCADLNATVGILDWRDMTESDYLTNDPNIPGSPTYETY